MKIGIAGKATGLDQCNISCLFYFVLFLFLFSSFLKLFIREQLRIATSLSPLATVFVGRKTLQSNFVFATPSNFRKSLWDEVTRGGNGKLSLQFFVRYWRCDIKGASNGKLQGKTVAIKDNTCVAGVPMMNGSLTLEGFVPDVDATVVSRILDAGGNIVGKSVCENLCLGSGSFTSATGPVLNPYNNTRMAGGSSSGSGALVRKSNVLQRKNHVVIKF